MFFSSVAVQNDFVRLSQSLQVELEKIRQEETEVLLSQSLQVELEKIRLLDTNKQADKHSIYILGFYFNF